MDEPILYDNLRPPRGYIGRVHWTERDAALREAPDENAVAQTATIYTVHVDLADLDRQVYEALDLTVARHPSETLEFMVVRLLAYCLEHTEGIAFTQGVSSGDEPAVVARDLTGRVTSWVEVGLPDPVRLHRASKMADRVAVYTHRDVRQFLGQLDGARIHKAESIPIRAFDRAAVEQVGALLDRRVAFSLTVSGDHLSVAFDSQTVEVPMTEHRLSPRS
jgi:uncharacterized protein YaeQ